MLLHRCFVPLSIRIEKEDEGRKEMETIRRQSRWKWYTRSSEESAHRRVLYKSVEG